MLILHHFLQHEACQSICLVETKVTVTVVEFKGMTKQAYPKHTTYFIMSLVPCGPNDELQWHISISNYTWLPSSVNYAAWPGVNWLIYRERERENLLWNGIFCVLTQLHGPEHLFSHLSDICMSHLKLVLHWFEVNMDYRNMRCTYNWKTALIIYFITMTKKFKLKQQLWKTNL